MNKNVFSDSWHKISNLKICLLNSANIQRQKYRDEVVYVIKEPYNNKYFKLSKEAYEFVSRLNIKHTVQETIDKMLEDKINDIPTQDEIIELVSSLHNENLLYFKNLAENDFIFERNKEKKLKEHKTKLYSFLFFKIPLVNPNNFLNSAKFLIDLLFSKKGLVLWIIVCILGLKSLIDNIDLAFNQGQGLLSPSNLFYLYIALAFMKVFHELSHSAMIKKFGGSVNTLGIMFLVLTPLPYMDATHSWFFKNKYQRMLVSFAGMMSDILFAALAAIVWSNTGDGAINSIAFNIMVIGSVSSILFNGNPLLRFDAYYILADYLEIPNLFQKSKEYFFYIIEKYIFKIENLIKPSNSSRESFSLLTYAIVSYLYRIVIAIGIIIYVADQLLVVGVLMAILTLFIWVINPLKNFVKYLMKSPKLYKTRKRAILISSTTFLVILYLIFFIPISNSIKAPGVIKAKDSINIYASTEGVVTKILVQSGESVKKGQVLVILENKDLEFDIESIKHSLNQIKIVRQKSLSKSSIDMKSLNEKEFVLSQKLNFLEKKKELLTIKAPRNGIFVSNNLENLINRYLKKQSNIGKLIQGDDLSFYAVISQEETYGLFEKKEIKDIKVKFYGHSDIEFDLDNVKIIPYAKNELPSAALGWLGGGDISVLSEDNDGKKTTELFFEITGVLNSEEKHRYILKEGRTGVIKIDLRKASLVEQIQTKITQLLQKRYKI